MQGLVTAMRSLLGFLHVTGRVRARLDAAEPSAPGRRTASLPRGIAAGQAAALLASCDRDSAAGRRDYAILILLTRMGLRAGEVTGLTLDDIDWRAGELAVRGKGDDHARLPLPADVGEAIADYLRYGRARTAGRHLFITVRAPFHHGAGTVSSRCGHRSPGWRATPASAGSSARHAGAPGSVRSGRTGCGTRSRATCWQTALPWRRSASCCGTAASGLPRSTRTLGQDARNRMLRAALARAFDGEDGK